MNTEERDVAKIFARHVLRLGVEVSTGKVGSQKSFPYIAPSSWIKYMDEKGFLKHWFGLGNDHTTLEQVQPRLLDFWKKYELTHRNHEVYKLAEQGALCLSHCLPCYIHGDEGTTYKRQGALVVSFFCPIGRGVAGAKSGENSDELKMNFVGHAFRTRFVSCAMLKDRFPNQLYTLYAIYVLRKPTLVRKTTRRT